VGGLAPKTCTERQRRERKRSEGEKLSRFAPSGPFKGQRGEEEESEGKTNVVVRTNMRTCIVPTRKGKGPVNRKKERVWHVITRGKTRLR